jgi:hypothetical protein
MFVERPLQTTAAGGYATQNTPEGLYNGANCMAILKALFEDCRLDRPPRQPDNARQFDNAAIDPQLRRNPGLKLPELIQRAAPDQPVRVAEQQSNPPRGGVRIAKMTKRFAGVAACSPFLVNASTALRQRSDRERNPTPGRLAA